MDEASARVIMEQEAAAFDGRAFTFGELRTVALDEAARIAATQTALLVCGLSTRPSREALLLREQFCAMARAFDMLKADPDLNDAFRRAVRRMRPGSKPTPEEVAQALR